jgi:hypothetical protein
MSRNLLQIAGAVVTLLSTARVGAQATFYQVPSGDITDPRDIYVQQQSTLTDLLDLSLQSMVGVGSNFDLGVSIYNFDLVRRRNALHLAANHSDRQDPFGPLALAMIQKRFDDPSGFGAFLGVQVGPNVAPLSSMRVAVRAYANVVAELGENRRCTAGGYVANGIFAGGSSVQYAPWAGCEIEILEELIEAQADWDFGTHANAGATLGPQLRVGKHVGIAVGVRVPNPWADEAKWGGVLQLAVKDPLGGH